MKPGKSSVVLAVCQEAVGQALEFELSRSESACQISLLCDLAELRLSLARQSPQVLLLDDAALPGKLPAGVLQSLSLVAPVILIADPESQPHLLSAVRSGQVEFVARIGNFIPLAAALVERCGRTAEQPPPLLSSWHGLPEDFAEMVRHEINNPLTGILGNAELLLAQRARLPEWAVRRLETVVDLAVRLRETTRRLTNGWKNSAQPLQPLPR